MAKPKRRWRAARHTTRLGRIAERVASIVTATAHALPSQVPIDTQSHSFLLFIGDANRAAIVRPADTLGRNVTVQTSDGSQNADGKSAVRVVLLLPQWDRPPIIATVLHRVVVIAFPAAEIV
jgi:hypothetical protein